MDDAGDLSVCCSGNGSLGDSNVVAVSLRTADREPRLSGRGGVVNRLQLVGSFVGPFVLAESETGSKTWKNGRIRQVVADRRKGGSPP